MNILYSMVGDAYQNTVFYSETLTRYHNFLGAICSHGTNSDSFSEAETVLFI